MMCSSGLVVCYYRRGSVESGCIPSDRRHLQADCRQKGGDKWVKTLMGPPAPAGRYVTGKVPFLMCGDHSDLFVVCRKVQFVVTARHPWHSKG